MNKEILRATSGLFVCAVDIDVITYEENHKIGDSPSSMLQCFFTQKFLIQNAIVQYNFLVRKKNRSKFKTVNKIRKQCILKLPFVSDKCN